MVRGTAILYVEIMAELNKSTLRIPQAASSHPVMARSRRLPGRRRRHPLFLRH